MQLRRAGQEVAGELLDREPVERQVAVDGVDHPVAVGPHRPLGVDGVAVGIGITRLIEPVPTPPLTVVGRGEQPVHGPLIRIG